MSSGDLTCLVDGDARAVGMDTSLIPVRFYSVESWYLRILAFIILTIHDPRKSQDLYSHL